MRITEYGIELVKEKATNYKTDNKHMNTPENVAELMRDVFKLDIKAEEYLYMLALDNQNNLIGVFEISHGTVNMTVGNPREIYVRALLANAVSIILVHNHPSGSMEPSRQDIELTKTVAEAGKIIGINLLDHIIIGADRYVSLKEKGVI